MNAKVLALSLASVLAVSANAQEVTSDYAQTTPAKDVAFKTGGKWFLTLQGGVNFPFFFTSVGHDAGIMSVDKMGYNAGLGIGTWWNPYFGTRLMIENNFLKQVYAAKQDNNYVLSMVGINPHIDFLFDMSNFWAPYDADRVFHFVPFIGVGYGMTQRVFDDKNATDKYLEDANFIHSATANAGINFDFHFSRNFALSLTPSVAVGNFYEVPTMEQSYEPNEVLLKFTAGLTFGLNNQAFEAVEPMDYDLLNSLQSEINSLRSQNAELSKRPVRCPECPEVTAAPVAAEKESVVYFRINSAKIDKNQFINIYQVAEFVKSTNTPITVTGYADVETGNPDYNMTLSEKRARNVADVLIEEYGVPSDLITIDYKGDTVQPFETNAWNRVVIMKNK